LAIDFKGAGESKNLVVDTQRQNFEKIEIRACIEFCKNLHF
jgi:hypothetical protein